MPGDAGPLYLPRFIYGQLTARLPIPSQSFTSKTVIITGSNTGLGLEAARHIVRLGASKVIIACRSTTKGEAAKKDIEASEECDGGIIEVWPVDLSNYASVLAFAKRASALERVDVLLANAGVAMTEWAKAEDDEMNVTINVVSTMLLALLMKPKLESTAKHFNTRATITFVTSDTHETVNFPAANAPEGIFASLNDEASTDMPARYPTSKLMLNFAVREMAARLPLEEHSVTINYINPGLCQSELSRHAGWDLAIMKALCARTTEEGSRTLLAGVCGGPETHGQYMSKCEVTQPATLLTRAGSEATQTKLWWKLMAELNKIQPGISAKVQAE